MQNYILKTAIRNFMRNKSFAFINIIGLAVGIASCLLIYSIIKFELSFDTFHTNKDNIYRVISEFKSEEGSRFSSGVPFPVADALRIDYPQLIKVADIYRTPDVQISILDKKIKETEKKFKETNGVFFTEPEFFEMFDIELLTGNYSSLGEPNNALLTQETAEKYFGNWEEALGKTIMYDNSKEFKVAGILKNIPSNSDFPFKVVLSYKSNQNYKSDDWVSTFGNHNCYILTPAGFDANQFNVFLTEFSKKHKPAEYVEKDGLLIQPLKEIHFDGRTNNYNDRTFSRELITALAIVGIFLLLIACVNYINLSTAQAVNRSREIGIRKVLGGNRKQLTIQFLTETFLLTVTSVILSVIISEIVLPYLNGLLQTSIIIDSSIVFFFIGIIIAVTLLSGIYPAIIMSGFNPITALRNKTSFKTSGKFSLRRGLVVFQFIIAQVLIIGMLVVVSQMDYFKNASLGFNKEEMILVSVPNDSVSLSNIYSLKNSLLQQPGISKVSFSAFSPIDDSHWSSDFRFEKSVENSKFNADLKWADSEYFSTYNIKLAAGKFYSESDTVKEFVVNETFVKMMGFKNPEDILGKELDFWDGFHVAQIVGVVKDFNSSPLNKKITPVVLSSWKEVYGLINIKVQPVNVEQTLHEIEKQWSSFFPDYVYDYQFLDEKIDGFYKRENEISQLYKIFAGIAILISCLGLFGLVSFMALQKTKEVGIRKVLGASASNIVLLFSKEFTVLVSVAFLIAAPISYYIMNKWLEDFAYRIEIGAGLFILAVFGSMFFAWLTVGYHSIKAAVANPVKALKYE